MVSMANDRAVWVKSFKAVLCNTFKDLQMQRSRLSKRTDCASFELEPHRDYTPELYIECRFDVFSRDGEVEALEKDAARIIVLLANEHKTHAERIRKFLREIVPVEFDVRVNKSGRRIYITKSGLPTLDLAVHVSKQTEMLKQYGDACVQLQKLWKANVPELDKFIGGLET